VKIAVISYTFFSNVGISQSKFEWVVFKLFNFVYKGQYNRLDYMKEAINKTMKWIF